MLPGSMITHSSALSFDRFMLMSPKPTVDITSGPVLHGSTRRIDVHTEPMSVMAKYIAVM